MAVYQYNAFTSAGEKVEGVIDAQSIDAARQKLKSRKLYVKEIKEDVSRRDRELFPVLGKLLHRVSRKEIGVFARQLGTLLGAGIKIDEALNDIYEQTDNQSLQKIVIQMKQSVVEGRSLSEAFAEHRDIFPPVYENMIRVGEATGSYEPTLHRLAELEEKNEELKSKAITAMIYPAFMLAISMGVIFFLLTAVVPQIENMFASFDAELPLPTRITLALSSLVQNFWALGILAMVGGVLAFLKYRSKPEGKYRIDRTILKIPFFGSLVRKIQVGRFARNLGTLLEANVPLLSALEITAGTAGNEVFKTELLEADKQIREGASIREALRSSTFLPQMARGMMAAGEASDRMPELLLKIADIMESDVDAAVRRLTTSLEPVMIVFMGGIVAGIMASVMLPLYKMTELIK